MRVLFSFFVLSFLLNNSEEIRCGKTALLNYLSVWLGIDFLVLNVHGGTTQEDITSIFDKAVDIVTSSALSHSSHSSSSSMAPTIGDPSIILGSKQSKTVYVFLDEVNTCAHMGLIQEAIVMRSLHGKFVDFFFEKTQPQNTLKSST